VNTWLVRALQRSVRAVAASDRRDGASRAMPNRERSSHGVLSIIFGHIEVRVDSARSLPCRRRPVVRWGNEARDLHTPRHAHARPARVPSRDALESVDGEEVDGGARRLRGERRRP
jgi:hypothetical protein